MTLENLHFKGYSTLMSQPDPLLLQESRRPAPKRAKPEGKGQVVGGRDETGLSLQCLGQKAAALHKYKFINTYLYIQLQYCTVQHDTRGMSAIDTIQTQSTC